MKNFWIVALAVIVFPLWGEAQVSVDQVIVTFKNNERPVHNATVFNNSEEPLYLNAQVTKIINPGTKEEKALNTEELIVSPKHFSLAAKAQRTVRILLKKPGAETEQVFRIAFMPQAKPDEVPAEQGQKTAHLKVLYTVGMLIFADPAEVVQNISWERTKDKILFKNEGTVNALLSEGKSCTAPDQNCKELPVRRLYPGAAWEVPVPQERIVFFRKEDRSGYEMLNIPPGEGRMPQPTPAEG